MPARLAVLISGRGLTLENILAAIADGRLNAQVVVVVASDAAAKGIAFARRAGAPHAVIERRAFGSTAEFSAATFDVCRAAAADYVVMAGYVKYVRIPDDFALRVVNIHPSLIPSFCGKNFYGHHVHQAVLDHGAKMTGCTVHFVDNQYDHGPIISQRPVPVEDDDTADSLAARVFEAEKLAYVDALAHLIEGRLSLAGSRVRISSAS